jgi:hypothetical protein
VDVDLFVVEDVRTAPLARHAKPLREAVDPDHALGAEQEGALDGELPDGPASPHGNRVTGLDSAAGRMRRERSPAR